MPESSHSSPRYEQENRPGAYPGALARFNGNLTIARGKDGPATFVAYRCQINIEIDYLNTFRFTSFTIEARRFQQIISSELL